MNKLLLLILIIVLAIGGYNLYQKIDKIESYLSTPEKEYHVYKSISPPDDTEITKRDITPQAPTVPEPTPQDASIALPSYTSRTVLIQIEHKVARALEKEARDQRRSLNSHVEFILEDYAKKSKFYKKKK